MPHEEPLNHEMTAKWLKSISGRELPEVEVLLALIINKGCTAEEIVQWLDTQKGYSGILRATTIAYIQKYAVPALPQGIQEDDKLLRDILYGSPPVLDPRSTALLAIHWTDVCSEYISPAKADAEHLAIKACIHFGLRNDKVAFGVAQCIDCIEAMPDFEERVREESKDVREVIMGSTKRALEIFLDVLKSYRERTLLQG